MAPWTDQDKDSLIRIIAEFGDLGRPGDSSFGFVHGWSTVVKKFNGDKHENEDGFRSKHSMQSQWSRSARFIFNSTKDIDFNFADDVTHGEMLLRRYEHAMGIDDAASAGPNPAAALPSSPGAALDQEVVTRAIEEKLDKIADELIDILGDVDDEEERYRLIDQFNKKFRTPQRCEDITGYLHVVNVALRKLDSEPLWAERVLDRAVSNLRHALLQR
ncbi:hypothetical protein BJ166DRAFT_590411 [Pestalotiopsis sp. NC0098]|nr:hypothetical protein BJ166DRAFT_590411 [Pestalotiopsis sp. NC0098]